MGLERWLSEHTHSLWTQDTRNSWKPDVAMHAFNPSIRAQRQMDPKNQSTSKFPVWWETLSQGSRMKTVKRTCSLLLWPLSEHTLSVYPVTCMHAPSNTQKVLWGLTLWHIHMSVIPALRRHRQQNLVSCPLSPYKVDSKNKVLNLTAYHKNRI